MSRNQSDIAGILWSKSSGEGVNVNKEGTSSTTNTDF